MQFYTGSGLRKVKLHVQFFGLYCWRGEITWFAPMWRWSVPRRTPLPSLYWATDKVDGPESKSVTTGKPISSQIQYGRLIFVALIRMNYIVLHAKLYSHLRAHMSGRIGLLTGRRVFWWAGLTCRGQLRAWSVGPRGTHFLQAPSDV
jgi:hypothetical protein